MFYRRKVLLSVVDLYGGKLSKIHLHKILFLICQQQKKPVYHFVPHQRGCYSFTLGADVDMLQRREILLSNESMISFNGQELQLMKIHCEDKKILLETHQKWSHYEEGELLKVVYTKYPYWAIKSTIAKKLLSEKQYLKLKTYCPKKSDDTLFTIGYEGITLEEYFNKLIKNDIKLLVDVRKNAYSMKFGFSKSRLSKFCKDLGMEYIHLHEVGINSEDRRRLQSQNDYEKLFLKYRETTLKDTIKTQRQMLAFIEKFKRVALTCFEADINQCHRKHLANSITKLSDGKYRLKHL